MRNLIVQSACRENHIVGPGAKGTLMEPIDIVDVAHPVGTRLAISTIPARDNLFTDGVIADFQPVQFSSTITESDHFTDKFVTWSDRRLAKTNPVLIAPKQGGARITFDVAGADTCGLHSDQYFPWTRSRHRPFFEPVIVRAVRHHCGHSFW